MNDTPHLMAIIDSKMAQARSCFRNNEAERGNDLLEQVAIYAAALGGGRQADTERPLAGRPTGCR